ncbi:hypothetical protein Slin15195_G019200 [Septoria linicola]|uniref:Uncharacterized protein n=1 Tax=Septoria linicola TaxID=215465 RepID=A0A9Q9EEB0_9PEZI|nr:hypothetical protein Slin14017_G019260 [Septoria linicola]USW48601.1 hypothetical protein Slin15195_G019200 [Septoria linicola]
MATSTATPSSSAHKPSPTANSKPNRLPAPTLFVGPPSRNASNLSISRQQAAEASLGIKRDPVNRHKSALSRSRNVSDNQQDEEDNSSPQTQSSHHTSQPGVKKASERDVESKWREMQNTLNEVELTAQSSTHVFGESHARALDDLRKAQVELARAWGRGNQDERDPTLAEDIDNNMSDRFRGADELARDRSHVHKTSGRQRGDTNTSTSTALSDESVRSDVTSKSGRSQLEDETKQDIKLASERRATNEAYFKKVDGGVREVVKKLEIVAEAMRAVEGESRSLWSESSTDLSSGDGGGRERGVSDESRHDARGKEK